MSNLKLKSVLVTSIILTVTFLYYKVSDIPEGFSTLDLYFFEIGSFGFPDIAHLVDYSRMKLLIIILSAIWYITCKHWWKFAILVIIVVELFKLVSALNPNNSSMDEIDYLTSLPVTIPIILLLIFISNKLNNYNLSKEMRSQIDKEIDSIFFELHSVDYEKFNLLKQEYLKAKKTKMNRTKSEYLVDLINLRDQFYKVT